MFNPSTKATIATFGHFRWTIMKYSTSSLLQEPKHLLASENWNMRWMSFGVAIKPFWWRVLRNSTCSSLYSSVHNIRSAIRFASLHVVFEWSETMTIREELVSKSETNTNEKLGAQVVGPGCLSLIFFAPFVQCLFSEPWSIKWCWLTLRTRLLLLDHHEIFYQPRYYIHLHVGQLEHTSNVMWPGNPSVSLLLHNIRLTHSHSRLTFSSDNSNQYLQSLHSTKSEQTLNKFV